MTIAELHILLDIGNAKSVLEAHASKCDYGYFFVDSNDGHCYLFDEDGNEKKISIIKEIDDTMIRKDIKKIVIPNSITTIYTWAFAYCYDLISIALSNNVRHIGAYAFWLCNQLTDMAIRNRVVYIGDSAFYGCENLINMTIPNSVTHIGKDLFGKCRKLTNVVISNNITSIESYTFEYCNELTNITIGSSIKNIEHNAFHGCYNLKNIMFKGKTMDQVKKMENYPWGIKDESIIKLTRPFHYENDLTQL